MRNTTSYQVHDAVVDSSAVAANRWLCEALAPLLPTLANALAGASGAGASGAGASGVGASGAGAAPHPAARASALLGSVAADWAAHVASNSLWLDRRGAARKVGVFRSMRSIPVYWAVRNPS